MKKNIIKKIIHITNNKKGETLLESILSLFIITMAITAALMALKNYTSIRTTYDDISRETLVSNVNFNSLDYEQYKNIPAFSWTTNGGCVVEYALEGINTENKPLSEFQGQNLHLEYNEECVVIRVGK